VLRQEVENQLLLSQKRLEIFCSIIIGYDHSQRRRTAEGELEKPARKMLCTPTAKSSSPLNFQR